MNREEAISEWTVRRNHIKKWLDENGEEPSMRHDVELIDIAIEALSSTNAKSVRSKCEVADLVSRADATDAVRLESAKRGSLGRGDILNVLSALPSALADIGDYADRLWKIAYERGKAEAEAVQGEWIDIDNYYRMATCSHCHKVTMFEKWGENTKPYDFCPNCGTRMKTEQEIEMGNKYMRILERIPNEILRELWLSDEGGER